MSWTITLDKAGRVVIPKSVRDELRLAPGDSLTLESDCERMTMHPVRSATALRKEHGVWVFRGGKKLSAAETDRSLADIREIRGRAARGSQ